MTKTNAYPVAEWLLSTPLYAPIPLPADEAVAIQGVRALVAWTDTFDVYCPGCGQMATFRGMVHPDYEKSVNAQRLANASMNAPRVTAMWEMPEIRKAVYCSRDRSHILIFYFLRRDAQVMKIGQYPSYADLAHGETQGFAKALGKGRVAELNTAIGLAAHGIGVGAFIYLRRVFESLVEEAHQVARNDPDWVEEVYQRLRMAERLPLLAGHLPAFLVEHAKLYSILSLHLHELSDDACRATFEVVKQGIFAIAEERLAEYQRRERATAARKAIAGFKPPTTP